MKLLNERKLRGTSFTSLRIHNCKRFPERSLGNEIKEGEMDPSGLRRLVNEKGGFADVFFG